MSNADNRKRIIVAGAGTGKTTLLKDIAIERCDERRVLYLTYTIANAGEFEAAVVGELGHLPASITIMTWFSFLLVHGVRPYPADGFANRIDRMLFNEGRASQRGGVHRGDKSYYCPKRGVVYRSRLSDLAVLCDEQWHGKVTDRICAIYDTILVDEGQDFAGYDYDILGSMMQKACEMVIVGDPRQQTYRTGNEPKYSGVRNVFDFFSASPDYTLDTTTLSTTYRCSEAVIALANSLYPTMPQIMPCGERKAGSTGKILKVKKSSFEAWARARVQPFTVLRYDSRTKVPDGFHTMNMGESKGLTLDDVVIFPTNEMKKWISDNNVNLKGGTRAKLYVAITRAHGDVIFVI